MLFIYWGKKLLPDAAKPREQLQKASFSLFTVRIEVDMSFSRKR